MLVISLMYDFTRQIAAGEKFPSLVFSFEPLDPPVLVHHSPVPERVKLAIVSGVDSVIRIFCFVSHDDVVPDRPRASQYH